MTKKDPAWAQYEKRSFIVNRKTAPPFDQWASLMQTMNQINQSHNFWMGDLYLAGEHFYGETRATSIMDSLDWNIKTLQNAAWVCRKVEQERRRDELTFSHHAEVSALDPDDQEHFLTVAVENSLSVRQLRDLIRSDDDLNVNFRKRPLDKFLEQEATKIANRKEEAAGDVYNLMQTAVDSLMDAYEIQRDSAQIDQAA